MLNKLVFLGMGGTVAGLAGTASDNIGYLAAQIGVDQLLGALPNLGERLSGYQRETEQVAQIDSKDMTSAHWGSLAQRVQTHLARPEVRSVVVTHGTDTLEETAYFLSRVLGQQALRDKAVVLTCAMRPASSSSADGPQNLLDAVTVAISDRASGVLVVCAGTVHSALCVQKVHPYRLNAFDSGEAGPLGFVEEGRVRWVQPCPELPPPAVQVAVERLSSVVWPRVEIVMSHVGASGATVRALCASLDTGDQPVQGIVVAGTGNGTIHMDLLLALQHAQDQGLVVSRTTRCAYGCVVPNLDEACNLLPSLALSPVKARIEMVLALLR